ncbi:MAG: amino acid adenylation domain-containing protein [Ruminococcus sp.]|jgi:D-alanine--poly(phosphoribitol) ligase subunit 1
MNPILDCLEMTEAVYGHRTAVDDGAVCLTWKELAELSRRLGTAFCHQTERKTPIVILMEKSALTLAAMLGTVYAGCFYVMADPGQPPERMKEILKVLDADLAVTDEKGEKLLWAAGYRRRIYTLKKINEIKTDEHRLQTIRKCSSETDLLYGTFTSGSTGIPKCIAVSQKAVVDFISHFTSIFSFTADDRIGNQAPFDFDVSVKDIYTCVMTGASLILIPRELFSVPAALLDYLCEKKVTSLTWAVSALTLVSSLKGLDYKVPESVRRVLFSGEIMPAKQLRLWQKGLPRAEFANLYGPSEITCNCTYYPVDRIFSDQEKIPIGKAFPGRDVFLLDESGKEILIPDIPGEICVGGESLAEGYYNNPGETASRFIRDARGRYYRTGDLGYYGIDGELYFSGRKDFQIKHMGHRIELEEIEYALEQLPGVERSCCLLDKRKNQLAAFYLGEGNPKEIKTALKEKVPLYMIPHKLIRTDRIPLNKNGKKDRKYFMERLEAEI